MIFKIIDQNTDHIINKPYYLCRVNFGDLVQFVKDKFKGTDFTKFNEEFETKIDEKVMNHLKEKELKKGYKEYLSYSYDNQKKQSFEKWREEEIKGKKESIQTDKKKLEHKEQLNNFIFNASTENNFISLYSEEVTFKGIDLIMKGKFYLLDGFRRLLYDFNYAKKNLKKDVYIKIYDKKTTDQDMMKIMFHFNLWKFPQGISVWLDRGWRFFLYHRLGIRLYNTGYGEIGHFTLLNPYLGKGRYGDTDYLSKHKVLTSEKFYDDLLLIEEIVKKPDLVDSNEKGYLSKNSCFAFKLMQYLGAERRKNNLRNMQYNDFIIFLRLNINEVNKIKKMGVHGFYIKRIIQLVEDFFEIWKDDKALDDLRHKDISKVKITEITGHDFVKELPKEVIDKFKIKGKSERIDVNGNSYVVSNGKAFLQFGSYSDATKYRIYFFFDKYVLFKYDKFYRILNTANIVKQDWQDNRKNVFEGNIASCLRKIKEMTGKDVKLNIKRTEFLI